MSCTEHTALAKLQQQWPAWGIFRSVHPGGELAAWYASRRGIALTEDDIDAGLARTLDAETADDLQQALAVQQRLEVGRSVGIR